VVFLYTLFYPLSFCNKKGEYFLISTGIVFLTGQVIFVTEWPKWEFVSLRLAAFCWTKSLPCNDAFK
jgi:predicted membrane channel-forming protein YqfA (hemolysin III family)